MTFLGAVMMLCGVAMLVLRGSVPATRMLFPVLADLFAGLALLKVIPVDVSIAILVMSLVNIVFLVNERRFRSKGFPTGTT
jgi:hypothetical protein